MWYAAYTDLNFLLCAGIAPGSCPWVGLGVKMYNKSSFGTFYTRKLNLLLRS